MFNIKYRLDDNNIYWENSDHAELSIDTDISRFEGKDVITFSMPSSLGKNCLLLAGEIPDRNVVEALLDHYFISDEILYLNDSFPEMELIVYPSMLP